MLTDLPLEIIGEIAGESRLVYHPLVLAYPAFARSLTLGDRLDFAEKFGYDCRVRNYDDEWWFEWSLDGKSHRSDGPAVEYADGTKKWCINGRYRREDGPAIEWADGGKEWFIGGELHREDGPAVEYASGDKYWYFCGNLHRLGGPAIEWSDGDKAWYLNGFETSEEMYNIAISKITS